MGRHGKVNESFKERNDVGHHVNVNFQTRGIGPVNDEARGVFKDPSSSISSLLPTSHNKIKLHTTTHTKQTKPNKLKSIPKWRPSRYAFLPRLSNFPSAFDLSLPIFGVYIANLIPTERRQLRFRVRPGHRCASFQGGQQASRQGQRCQLELPRHCRKGCRWRQVRPDLPRDQG